MEITPNQTAITIAPALIPLLQQHKVLFQYNVTLSRGLMFNGPVQIYSNSALYSCSFDAYSYVSHDSSLRNVKVGRFCCIAHCCEIGGPIVNSEEVSTSAALDMSSPFAFYARNNARLPDSLTKAPYEYYGQTELGHDVWIGAHVKIPAGVKIGQGAAIAANTVVTGDVPPYAVVGSGYSGMKILKTRFSDEIIADIMDSKWWEYDLPIVAERNELTADENDLPAMLELLKQAKTASWPQLKDNWYYLLPENSFAVKLYPVPANFAYQQAIPACLNEVTIAKQQQVLAAQTRYEKTHPTRRIISLNALKELSVI